MWGFESTGVSGMAVAGACVAIVTLLLWRRATAKAPQFPRPPGAKALFSAHREQAWLRMSALVGGARTFMFDDLVATFEPSTVRKLFVLKAHTASRSPIYHFYGSWMPCNDGLLVQDGDKWSAHRKALLPFFQAAYFDDHGRAVRDALLAELTQHLAPADGAAGHGCAPGASDAALVERRAASVRRGGLVVDTLAMLKAASARTLLAWGFGMNPDSALGTELREEMLSYLVIAWDDFVDAMGLTTLPKMLWHAWRLKRSGDSIVRIVGRVLKAPVAAAPAAASTASASPLPSSEGAAASATARAAAPAMAGAAAGYVHDAARPNMLQSMVEAGLTPTAVANEVNHLHGAHKAVAFVLVASLFEVAQHPAWAAAMRAELSAVLASAGTSAPTDDADADADHEDEYEEAPLHVRTAARLARSLERVPRRTDLKELPVCMAVMNEVLRTHVVSYGIVRYTGEPLEMTPGDPSSTVPAKTNVMIALHALHHDPALWGADAAAFNPARWLAADQVPTAIVGDARAGVTVDAPPRDAFFPFVDGQRQCAGKALAELEWVVTLHTLLQLFDLRPVHADGDGGKGSGAGVRHNHGGGRLRMKDSMFTHFEGPVPCAFVPRA